MFKTAARKIAHNSTLPSLAGKQDLRALQDLITQEKTVLTSLQRLSVEFGRAADNLRVWGQGEGDDLGDTLSASATLLQHFSTALNVLAEHEFRIRDVMKTVRTREENLDGLKRRRKSVFSDAEGAERKLSKMAPENKNLQQQTDLLNRLREEIRTMDAEIMSEEASLGDFKRASVREWLGHKFGGLLECCEKGRIAGELGKLVIQEIPTELTQPGFPRPYYSGYARTEFLLAEAQRSMSEVVFSPEVDLDPAHRSIRPLPGAELPPISSPPQSQRRMSMGSMNGNSYMQASGTPSQFSNAPPTIGPYPGLPQVDESGFSMPHFMSPTPSNNNVNTSVNEFGTYSSPPTNQPSSFSFAEREKPPSSPRGGRFATFPVKAIGPRPPPGGAGASKLSTNPYIVSPPIQESDRPPSLDIDRGNDESFSSSIANALGQYDVEGPSGSSSSGAPQLPHQDIKSGLDFAPQRYSPPPPMYTPSDDPSLPPGAAPPNPSGSFFDNLGPPTNGGADGPSSRPHSALDEEEGLAYMSPQHKDESNESVSDIGFGDRRVRFGGVTDVDQALELRRPSEEKPPAPAHSMYTRVPVPPLELEETSHPVHQQSAMTGQNGRFSPEAHRQPESPTYPDSNPGGRSLALQTRVSTPPATEILMDERALNAAAAREVSRELDALMISSPPLSPHDPPPPSPFSTRPAYGAMPNSTSPYGNLYGSQRSVSPFPPPNQSQQSMSPMPSPNQPRSVSPLPRLNTSPQYPGPSSAPQAMSPKLEGYVRQRERERSGSIPTVNVIAGPGPSSPAGSDGSDQRPSINVSRTSPAPSTDTNGTPFRTPMSTPSGLPGSGSLYSMPATAGSNASFSAQAAAPRMISAAAFRRPQPQLRSMSSDNGMAETTIPLNVKKRLPASPSPHPSPMSSPLLQAGTGYSSGMRSVSAPHRSASLGPDPGPGEQDRPVSHYRQDGEEEDFDFSAYTYADRASGYGYDAAQAATRREDADGIR